jgi:hypothetical protein
MIGFEKERNSNDFLETGMYSTLGLDSELDNSEILRLKKIKREWNFYEGYHWEEIPERDGVETTTNFCRAFVDKFVSFELGDCFKMSIPKEMENVNVGEGKNHENLLKYLQYVWKDNNQRSLVDELGQMKSVTGESWIQVRFESKEDLDANNEDPYNEYPHGRIRLMLMPTSSIWATFDTHNREVLNKVMVLYTYDKKIVSPLGRVSTERTIFKQEWTKEKCVTTDGKDNSVEVENKYKIIPFIQIKNLSIAGRSYGLSDLEDLIPLNMEYNLKKSDVSEIIDYHAAPITVVYGAKIGNLEKGANKMWGGLSKDARVENLTLQSDLGASNMFIDKTHDEMCEVGGIPKASLVGESSISNTSGVALQYVNLPLVDKTKMKKNLTTVGLKKVCKLIVLVSLLEGLITKPEGVDNSDFYDIGIDIPDTLPKDRILELQNIAEEIKLGLESRRGALERLNVEDVKAKMKEVDEDAEEHPEYYGISKPTEPEGNPNEEKENEEKENEGENKEEKKVNSGMSNSQTPIESVRTEIEGGNGINNEVA